MTAQEKLLSSGAIRTLFGAVGRYNDLALAGLLIAIVGLFVLPLPTPVLDLLITVNLAASLVLLIVAMYVPSAVALSTFPSLLLFTTLFRLALNIASAKLILLHAHAGQIIETFGKLIVGNNVVVGGVVFLVIAVVQFIVIAKGSERVAEVGARFALDAMPGKQMSIDAEVRAGVMSSAEAQRRRQELEEECQLHGAMDGAMKFVKGDAIAAIVIAIVNILAGIAIGTMMHDMSVGTALQRYAILTVGDGMVSQIPSLLVSIAAGVVITRGGGAKRGGNNNLATQIGRQIGAHPRALIISGVAFASFLLVPGFPRWAFGLMAVLICGSGVLLLAVHRKTSTHTWISYMDSQDEAITSLLPEAVACPLAVRMGSELKLSLDRHSLDQFLADTRSAIEDDLGPVVPAMRVVYSTQIPGASYQILVQDVSVGRGVLKPESLLVDPSETNEVKGGELGEPFGPFSRAMWIADAQPNIKTLTCEQALAAHVDQVVRRHAAQLLGLQEVQRLIHVVQRDAPDLAAEVARVVPIQKMTEVLRRLLQEGIPIRNLRLIFESLVAWVPKEQDIVDLTELVRMDLGRYITSRYVGSDRRLNAILFDSHLIERLHGSINRSPQGNLLTVSPAVTQDVREQVRRLMQGPDVDVERLAAVVPISVRRYVKTLIEPAISKIPVLSYQEIDADVALQPVGWVTNPQVD